VTSSSSFIFVKEAHIVKIVSVKSGQAEIAARLDFEQT